MSSMLMSFQKGGRVKTRPPVVLLDVQVQLDEHRLQPDYGGQVDDDHPVNQPNRMAIPDVKTTMIAMLQSNV